MLDRFDVIYETSENNNLLLYIRKLSPQRFEILEQFIKQMDLFGNPYENVFVNGIESEAHYIIIDITYRYGYIVEGLFTIWYLTTLVKRIMVLFNNRLLTHEYLFLVFVVFGYFIISMLDTVSTADRFMIGYCFHLSTGILFSKDEMVGM